MRKFGLSTIGCIAGTVLAAYFLPAVHAREVTDAVLVGAVLSGVYQLLRPLLKLFTFPLAFLTFGLLNVLIDAGLLWMVAKEFEGYTFENFGWAIVTAVIVNIARRVCRSFAKR